MPQPGETPDVAMTVTTGSPVEWFCRRCGEPLQMVTDPISGVVDWGADGDYGCDESPQTDDEGTGNHAPVLDAPQFRSYWQRQTASL